MFVLQKCIQSSVINWETISFAVFTFPCQPWDSIYIFCNCRGSINTRWMETFITYPTTRNRKRLTILTINDSKTKAAGNNHFEHEVKSRASRQSHRLSRAARRRTTNVNSRKYQVNFANTTRNEYCKQSNFTVWPFETLIVIATSLFDHKISKISTLKQ